MCKQFVTLAEYLLTFTDYCDSIDYSNSLRGDHMNNKLFDSEIKVMEIIWENEPISSSALVRLCEERLTWKKSTTFTVLRRLCEKGLFKNEKGVVSSLISKQDFYSLQSERFVEETFDGSLPAFIAAFTARKKLTKEEVSLLRKMINEYKEEQ